MADIISVNDTNISVRLAGHDPLTGKMQFLAPTVWYNSAYYGDKNTAFADVDGDGRADAIAVNGWGISVLKATAQNTFSGVYGDNTNWTANGGAFYGNLGTHFADVNGDGKADAIVVNTTTGINVRPSTGHAFGTQSDWTANTPYYGNIGVTGIDGGQVL